MEEPYQAPAHRLTPLIFTRPHVCARLLHTRTGTSSLVVNDVDPNPVGFRNASQRIQI